MLMALTGIVLGQVPTGSYPPPSTLITIPTAGTLVRGSFAFEIRIQNHGGLIAGLSAGITDRFQFGLSFGANNLIGDDSLQWYPRPEANVKYRIIDESSSMPGIAVGINTQGYGVYNSADSLKRYAVKAYGLYLAASKNWKTFLGNLGIHGGINYNFIETNDGDRDPNLFFGFDMELNPELSLLLEYNAALNENDMTAKTIALNRGGYLNAAVRWTFVERLHIEIDFNNLLFDQDKVDYFNRELKLTYIEYF
jgi:hypothetical protein